MVVKKSEDISRKIVFVMLVAAIITFSLGIWTVISAINSITLTNGDKEATGFIAISIAPDKNNPYHEQYFEEKEELSNG